MALMLILRNKNKNKKQKIHLFSKRWDIMKYINYPRKSSLLLKTILRSILQVQTTPNHTTGNCWSFTSTPILLPHPFCHSYTKILHRSLVDSDLPFISWWLMKKKMLQERWYHAVGRQPCCKLHTPLEGVILIGHVAILRRGFFRGQVQ